ncbi:MFS transporter [Pararhizobium sp. BT-229]|uniref:MFS transporter n=1 Tax=Pararhizobium sp. BT-229 TaxID=2986923 RepID=UPI0021F77AE9|nr:MFS transporter [Pararhizobium sp. BT-229]MCV9960595.1 MFS transporter [Pararhizobium sp. BT-229]
MPLLRSAVLRSVLILSITQIIGWGALFMAISVTGEAMAVDLGLSRATIFLGPTLMLVVMAVCSPPIAGLYRRFGARPVLAAGSLLAAPGLFLLAVSYEPIGYFAAWAIFGIAGAACLTTSAHVFLAELAGEGARRAIGAQMLFMALAPSLSWPVTDFLEAQFGWRSVSVIYGCVMLFVCLPLHLFALPKTTVGGSVGASAAADGAKPSADHRRILALITVAIALNGFITWGFQLVVIDLFRSFDVADYLAVGFGSAIGVVQMSARLFDFLGGNRWNGLATGLVAALIMPICLIVLAIGGGTEWSILLFLLLYGLSSGAMSVSRATMPLVFFTPAEYAGVAARLGLPLNLAFAAAPPFFTYVLSSYGNRAALTFAFISSLGTLASMVVLHRLARFHKSGA